MKMLTTILSRLALRNLPIAYKLALAFSLLMMGSTLLFGVVILHDQRQLLERQTSELGATVAEQMAKASQEPLLAHDLLALRVIVNNMVSGNGQVLGAALYADNGEVLASAGLVPTIAHITNASAGQSINWLSRQPHEHDLSVMSFISPISMSDVTAGYALISLDHSHLNQAYAHSLNTTVAVSIGVGIIGILVSLVVGRLMSRPIYRLIEISRNITAGNYQSSFSEQRGDEFGALMSTLETMRQGLLRKAHVEHEFSRSVSPQVARLLLAEAGSEQASRRHVEASVLFADIVGFTSLSERMVPAEVSELLNDYFNFIVKAAHACKGHVDKYIGDCVMLVFGAPVPDKDHRWHAVHCAVLIQRIIHDYNQSRRDAGLATVQFRIGVNSGVMLAGPMGAPERSNYTVVGDAVNLAARLSGVASSGQIIISEELNNAPSLNPHIISTPHGDFQLKGKRETVATYRVIDVASADDAALQTLAEDILNVQDSTCSFAKG